MSPAQWAFEYSSLKKRETETFDVTLRAFKAILVNVLGLNALRPTDDFGRPKEYDVMTEDEREAFLPLVAWVGHPEILKEVKKQIDNSQHGVNIPDDEYEEMVRAIDEAGGDMEPLFQDVTYDPDTKQLKLNNNSDIQIKIDKL